eukprot:CAMPEP_0194182398 /NCGR_PEP_ID=MMETSP0154-20130528/23643_1 /TAXON_ID=1049557 /ORGANISM="Thalassiothrix antarctica, Strain L6-D1" /LENGTH=79 /DNA_ID=CAMNT_0038898659 /DNA_START=230 /DNA_END=469 /DNA_ORIENTATION=-
MSSSNPVGPDTVGPACVGPYTVGAGAVGPNTVGASAVGPGTVGASCGVGELVPHERGRFTVASSQIWDWIQSYSPETRA